MASRKSEIGLIGMAHRTTYVLQSTIAHANHMIEGFIKGLKSRRPALFNLILRVSQSMVLATTRASIRLLVVEARAYLFRYDPVQAVAR